MSPVLPLQIGQSPSFRRISRHRRARRLLRRRHDNDAERISHISVAPTAGEILCERPPYVPRNAPSTWAGMEHLKVRWKRSRLLAAVSVQQIEQNGKIPLFRHKVCRHIFGRSFRCGLNRPARHGTPLPNDCRDLHCPAGIHLDSAHNISASSHCYVTRRIFHKPSRLCLH